MGFAPGARLGPFEITEPLGSGGMGDVYKARDTRLDRTVAIKVLQAAAGDASARERLAREARAISALNHPHICTLHDIGADKGVDFLVMEYVEGETLATRLARGPLPIDQALTYGVQILSALDRAHRAGIVHRDIKPGNVMLTRAGVKLLDFGLAKSSPPLATGDGRTLSGSADLTQSGSIVGTVQYMAPEQLEGRSIDARTDIFAFGVLLYEMVSGRKAFEARSAASSIAAILEREPARLSSVQPLTPPALDRIVATCLEKNPDDRWQTARDLMREAQWVIDSNAHPESRGQAAPPRISVLTRLAATAGGLLLLALAVAYFTRAPVPPNRVRFTVPLPNSSSFVAPEGTVPSIQLALSPDGRRLAFVAASRGSPPLVWIRDLEDVSTRALEGTNKATYPFWSPDSQSIGFFAEGKLKRIELIGGAPRVLSDAPNPTGGTWNREGVIVFSDGNNRPLSRVLASGGPTTEVTALDASREEVSHRWPHFLPDGRHFLYLTRSRRREHEGIYVTSLAGGPPTRLLDSHWNAEYAAPGFLLFLVERTLMAQRFNPESRQLEGEPQAVFHGLAGSSTDDGSFSVSESGVLAIGGAALPPTQLVWHDRTGKPMDTIAPPGDYVTFSLARDDGSVAFSRVDPQQNTPDIWLLDLERGSSSRFTVEVGLETHPIWSPDGSQIIFRSYRGGIGELFLRSANGSDAEVLTSVTGFDKATTDWSADGRTAVYLHRMANAASRFDLWFLTLPERKAQPFLQTPFTETHGRLSPNGRFIAYASDESGRVEVYVSPFPTPTRRWTISTNGGTEPSWSRHGKELFYLGLDGTLMTVPLNITDSSIGAGVPAPLFDTGVRASISPYRTHYQASADAQRFLVTTPVPGGTSSTMTVLLDWRAALAPK